MGSDTPASSVDERTRVALARASGTTGEEAAKVTPDVRACRPDVPRNNLIGAPNRLA